MFDMCKVGFALLASAVSLAVGSPARAALINGDFATGDFTGWTTVGNTIIDPPAIGQYYPHPPNGGTYQAQISSYDTSGNPGGVRYTQDISPSSLETQLGLPAGSLTSQNPNVASNSNVLSGSGISQYGIALNAGQTVSFTYDFLTNETPGSTRYNDFAFFEASSDTGYVSPLQTIASVASSHFNNYTIAPDFPVDTGFQNYSFTAPSSGNYTIRVGVTNVGSGTTGGSSDSGTSAILADNFKVAAVPEPSFTPSMLSLFAAGSVLYYWRRRN